MESLRLAYLILFPRHFFPCQLKTKWILLPILLPRPYVFERVAILKGQSKFVYVTVRRFGQTSRVDKSELDGVGFVVARLAYEVGFGRHSSASS